MNKLILMLAALLAFPSFAADELADSDPFGALKLRYPELQTEDIRTTPVPGLYEVVISGGVYYVTDDGKYLMQGSLINMETKVNLTEARETETRALLMANLDSDSMIVYTPPGGAKHSVTVFTDISCGYCRKLHAEMADYHAQGIEVRYLFFPRAGVESPAGRQAQAVWCADDPAEALDQAKAGATLPEKSCDNPIANQYALGQQFGVRGTPALLTASGKMIPGYMPATNLLAALIKDEQETAAKQAK